MGFDSFKIFNRIPIFPAVHSAFMSEDGVSLQTPYIFTIWCMLEPHSQSLCTLEGREHVPKTVVPDVNAMGKTMLKLTVNLA